MLPLIWRGMDWVYAQSLGACAAVGRQQTRVESRPGHGALLVVACRAGEGQAGLYASRSKPCQVWGICRPSWSECEYKNA